MERLKSLLGYAWAILILFIVLATFLGNGYFSRELTLATGITISPWFSGGEIVKVIEHGAYRTLIHRPVFDGLLTERKTGFIQVNWEPLEGLPATVEEQVGYAGDRKDGFMIRLDTGKGKAILAAHSSSVVSVDGVYRLKKGWAVRVLLQKSN